MYIVIIKIDIRIKRRIKTLQHLMRGILQASNKVSCCLESNLLFDKLGKTKVDKDMLRVNKAKHDVFRLDVHVDKIDLMHKRKTLV
jgi:hypothetical protein